MLSNLWPTLTVVKISWCSKAAPSRLIQDWNTTSLSSSNLGGGGRASHIVASFMATRPLWSLKWRKVFLREWWELSCICASLLCVRMHYWGLKNGGWVELGGNRCHWCLVCVCVWVLSLLCMCTNYRCVPPCRSLLWLCFPRHLQRESRSLVIAGVGGWRRWWGGREGHYASRRRPPAIWTELPFITEELIPAYRKKWRQTLWEQRWSQHTHYCCSLCRHNKPPLKANPFIFFSTAS